MGLDPVRFGAPWCRLLSMNERLSHSAALGESLPAPHLLDIVTRHTGATICVVDTSLNILYANEAYANWFKVRPKELLGRTLTSLYSEAARAQFGPHIDRALAGHEVTYQRQIATSRGVRSGSPSACTPGLMRMGKSVVWSILRWRCTSSR